MQVDITSVKPHPRNKQIYGDYEITDLKESLERFGQLQPILISTEDVIISGHRRWYAARDLGWDMIEATKLSEKLTNEEEIRDLILSNDYREKSMEVKIREGRVLEEVEKELAKIRQGSRMESVGTVRDIVGKKIGVSGKTYENGKRIVEKIDELKEKGETAEAKKLSESLNKSVNSAMKTITKNETPEEYWYWDSVSYLIGAMNNIHKKLAKNRNSTTPNKLGYMIGNIKDMAMRLQTWDPKNMADCPACEGTAILDGDTCPHCINGKSGMARETNL